MESGPISIGNTKTTKRHESHETQDTPFVPFASLRVIRVSNAPPPNTKPLPCLTQKAALGILSEPGLPGLSRKGHNEGPTAPGTRSVPFLFPPQALSVVKGKL
jgi:hypothetical protein